MHTMSTLFVQTLPHFGDLDLPRYESEQAAGMDLRAANEEGSAIVLQSNGGRALIPTGLAIALEPGFEAQIRPRSGLAYKHGVTVLNAPGTIDSDYRGEVKVLLINHSDEDFVIERGMRIAQMVIAPVIQIPMVKIDSLSDTDRGAGGFGSTGH
ncbi:MAG: dUTP diphosphatase [Cohaesibacter sp.]|jgi:dUTP pyrophosphatase|nr:dUTP diphosphatase [Cohaesibacter sp.]